MFLNNRYYDPTTGVFLTVDPLVATTGEPYLYGWGNPTTLSDPTGLCSTSMVLNGCRPSQGSNYGNSSRSGGNPTAVPRQHFEPQPGLGIVRTNLFIAEGQVGEPFATSDGNDRGFSPAAGRAQSKVCIVVNFEEGWVQGEISPTCHDGVCTDAYRLGAGNTFDINISASDDGGLVVDMLIDALNPRAPKAPVLGAPAIDLRLRMGVETVSRPGNPSLHVDSVAERVFFVEAAGDGYPSLESYIVMSSGTSALIQDREGPHVPVLGPLPLWPLYPDRVARYERPL